MSSENRKTTTETDLSRFSRRETTVEEGEKQYDINCPNIYVRKVYKTNMSKFGKEKKTDTVWNQAYACIFCKKVITNISKHLKKHKRMPEIKEIKQLGKHLGKRHKKVMAKWALLRNKGDHQHNLLVIGNQSGEFILGRRQDKELNVNQYGACPRCLEWIKLDKTMCRHQKICPEEAVENKMTKKELRIASLSVTGRLSNKASKGLTEEVFPIMTCDEISESAQHDDLIISLGNLWLVKNIGNKLKRKYYTSSRMRDVARLLKNLREHTKKTEMTMSDFLSPQHFDDVVTAAFMTASVSIDDEEELKSPSTAIKIGYDIKRMVGAKWAAAIKAQNTLVRKECEHFMKLMEFEWSTRVSKIASTLLTVRRFNKEKQLPVPQDLEKLQSYVKEEISKLRLEKPSLETYRRVIKLAETRLLIYNKRRAGEIEAIR